ncbi:MAG: tRNA (adenosine(37)-N6)-threonylcarbamoyltransferase complex ATPase subunit type 1 TsaE [Deltaproteobacteria bacterium]|nr:tRNA (adenosine(37)-N6)-threonylcarbamoyltransferase complex ATPase subunit type 1 TsaE [Deltaproteobacteria bacterium]
MEITYHYDELPKVAEAIAQLLIPSDVVGLSGDLGAGKTTLIKSIASFFGIPRDEVTSPTYVYQHIYKGQLDIHHVDLYRISDEQTLLGLGIVEAMEENGIFLVEWIDRFPACFTPYLHIRLEVVDQDTRKIKIDASGWPLSRQQSWQKVFV